MKNKLAIIASLFALTASAEYIRQATETYPGSGPGGGITAEVATNIAHAVVSTDVAPWAMAGQPKPSAGGVATNDVKAIIEAEVRGTNTLVHASEIADMASKTWVTNQNYVTESVTNGLASISDIPTNYLVSANVAGGTLYITNSAGVGISFSGGGSGTSDYSLLSNKPQINGVELLGSKTHDDLGINVLTNGLASESWVTNQNYVTESITNGLVTASVTNGLASQSWVEGKQYVTETVTNGLATTNYVNELVSKATPGDYLNVSNNAYEAMALLADGTNRWNSVTNKQDALPYATNAIPASVITNAPWLITEKDPTVGLTNDTVYASGTNRTFLTTHQSLAWSNDYRRVDAKINWADVTNHADFVTESVTNGLASEAWVANQNYVTESITNGLVTASVTNGLASQTWVTNKNYVTESVTNGILAAANKYTDDQIIAVGAVTPQVVTNIVTGYGYVTSNDVRNIASSASVTNLGAVVAAQAMTNALPAWTKTATKPTYTASEVGAVPVSGGSYTGEVNVVSEEEGSQMRLRSKRLDISVTNDSARVKVKNTNAGTAASIFADDEHSYLSLSGATHGLDIDDTGKITTDEGAEILIPNKSGTLALTSDIPAVGLTNDTVYASGTNRTFLTTHQSLAWSNDYRRVDAKINWADVTNHADFVTESVTNGLASEAWVTNQNYVTASITNDIEKISKNGVTVWGNLEVEYQNGWYPRAYYLDETHKYADPTWVSDRTIWYFTLFEKRGNSWVAIGGGDAVGPHANEPDATELQFPGGACTTKKYVYDRASDQVATTNYVKDGKLTISQNGQTMGIFSANQGDDTSIVFISPDWRETNTTAASYIRRKPDLSALNPVTPGTVTLDQLIVQYNALLAALKGEEGGYDFSSLPLLDAGNTQAQLREAINLMITIAMPMGGMPPLMDYTVTDAGMRATFNATKAAIQASGHYDVSSILDMTDSDTNATFRNRYNALAAILKSHR